MQLKRFFADYIKDDLAYISGDEFKHCINVTRHKLGFEIIVSINDQYDYYAKIIQIEKDFLVASVQKRIKNDNEASKRVILFQAVCKELDFIVQKAVELGVAEIYPVLTKFSGNNSFNYARLQKIILAGVKQCERSKTPVLHQPIDFCDAVNVAKNSGFCILSYEKAQKTQIPDCINQDCNQVCIFIGSEGGFSTEEVDLAIKNGFNLTTLGRRILRAETAAISALTLAMFALGEMK